MLQACTVLYKTLPAFDAAALKAALHRLVGPCTFELSVLSPAGAPGVPVTGGLAEFGDHRVALIALPYPVRKEILEVTVDVSPMPDAARRDFAGHGAAVRVLYVGSDPDPIEQLIALYHVAQLLLDIGGIRIINERAALAQPAEMIYTLAQHLGEDVPPIQLWTGAITFVLGENEEIPRYILRVFGMDQCGLPEVAIYIKSRSQADDAYHVLMNVCLYFVQSRLNFSLSVGDRVEFGGHTYLLTDPGVDSSEFASQTGILLLVDV
ncbi:MAG: hypothetical protein ABIQ44_12230 [Chloroflexia bacterium]